MRSAELREAMMVLHDRLYHSGAVPCHQSTGFPCGPNRTRLGNSSDRAGAFCPPSLPSIGPDFGSRRRVVFLGLNPQLNWLSADMKYSDARSLFANWGDHGNPDKWEMGPFRKRLVAIARAAFGEDREAGEELLACVAFCNLIKCSTDMSRATPGYGMKVHCPPRIWAELDLLEPDIVVALGSEVHERLATAAGHAGRRVHLPIMPWLEYVSEIEISGRITPVVGTYHPAGLRSVNSYWSNLRDKSTPIPKTGRIDGILIDRFGTTSPEVIMDQITKSTGTIREQSGVETLLVWLDQVLLGPQGIPLAAWKDCRSS
jgi:hypothetical protein